MSAEEQATRDAFEELSEHDSKSIFKPSVLALIVTASENHGPNVMTAAWWMLGGYDPFRYVVSIGHGEYTHEILDENPEFVMAAPTAEMIDDVVVSGSVSGRDVDKIDHLGLETVPGRDIDVPLLANAVGNIECSVMETFSFEGCTYFIAGVENAYARPDARDGRVLSADADPLAYLGNDRDEGGDKYRYFLDYGPENVQRAPDESALEGLPDNHE